MNRVEQLELHASLNPAQCEAINDTRPAKAVVITGEWIIRDADGPVATRQIGPGRSVPVIEGRVVEARIDNSEFFAHPEVALLVLAGAVKRRTPEAEEFESLAEGNPYAVVEVPLHLIKGGWIYKTPISHENRS